MPLDAYKPIVYQRSQIKQHFSKVIDYHFLAGTAEVFVLANKKKMSTEELKFTRISIVQTVHLSLF